MENFDSKGYRDQLAKDLTSIPVHSERKSALEKEKQSFRYNEAEKFHRDEVQSSGNRKEISETSISRIKELFLEADQAKDSNDYDTANMIFAYLYKVWSNTEEVIKWGGRDGDRGLVNPIKVEYETNNDDPYYDLPVLTMSDNGRQLRLCIPNPLLTKNAISTILRSAKIVDRLEHNRVVSKDGPNMERQESTFAKIKHRVPEDVLDREGDIEIKDVKQKKSPLPLP